MIRYVHEIGAHIVPNCRESWILFKLNLFFFFLSSLFWHFLLLSSKWERVKEKTKHFYTGDHGKPFLYTVSAANNIGDMNASLSFVCTVWVWFMYTFVHKYLSWLWNTWSIVCTGVSVCLYVHMLGSVCSRLLTESEQGEVSSAELVK